jgi:lipoate-protein ligase B
VTDLEEVLLRTLAEFGIEGGRDRVHRGVWVEGKKIASVGIRISRWVTSHGFALNVNTDLSYFSLIHPCGIVGCPMTSISQEKDSAIDMQLVKEIFTDKFTGVFGRAFVSEADTRSVARG